jgi:hypothetical protein
MAPWERATSSEIMVISAPPTPPGSIATAPARVEVA